MRPIGLSHHLMDGEENSHTGASCLIRKKCRVDRTSRGEGRESIAIEIRLTFGSLCKEWKRCLAGSGAAASTALEIMARAATTSDSFNAVAEPRRREILNYLALQERAVGDIAVGLKMEQPSVSKHLRVLRNVGLVRVRRNGRHMFYRTNAEAIQPLHEWTKTFAAQWQHKLIRWKK